MLDRLSIYFCLVELVAFFMYSIKNARKTAMNNATTVARRTIFFTLFDRTELVVCFRCPADHFLAVLLSFEIPFSIFLIREKLSSRQF